MKTFLKILGGMLMVLIVGLAIFIATFDINQYKPRIIALVSEHTGRTFDIFIEFAALLNCGDCTICQSKEG